MNADQENRIYKNIFTQEEIDSIYNAVESCGPVGTQIVPIYAQKAYHMMLPEQVVNKVESFVNEFSKEKVVLTEISFASYSKEFGDLPLLSPHFDNTFKEPRLTFDIQLKSNIDWPIVIKGRPFLLKDNEALTFSGTHQVHWRPFREFKNGEFIDMVFCHFSLAENRIPTKIEDLYTTIGDNIFHMNRYYQDIIRKMQKQ